MMIRRPQPVNGQGESVEQIHPALVAIPLVLVAALYRIFVISSFSDEGFTFNFGHLVKGVPVSDGAGWDSAATDFALGERFPESVGAARPFYWIFMGSVYALTGPWVAVTQAVHVVLGSISVGLIFEVCRWAASTPMAVVVALAYAINLVDALFCMVPATEPLGAFLTNASLCALVLGAASLARNENEKDAPRRWGVPFLTSGMMLALANLSRPLNLPVIGVWPFLLVLVCVERPRRLGSWRRPLGAAGLLILGCLMTLAPWLVYQRARYGVWMLTESGAETFYLATSPRHQSAEDARASAPRSISDRHDFYRGEVFRRITEYPGRYLRNALWHGWRVVDALSPGVWLGLALCGIFLLSHISEMRRRHRLARLLVSCATVTAGMLLLPPPARSLICLIAAVIALVRRHPMTFVAGLLVVTEAVVALTGTSGELRFVYPLRWMASALFVWLLWEVLDFATFLRVPRSPWSVSAPIPSWGAMGRLLGWTAAMAVFVWTIGLARAVIAGLGPPTPLPPVTVSQPETAHWVDRVLRAEGAKSYRNLRIGLEARRATIRRDYVMSFRAGEWVTHWSPLYTEPRPYAFQVFETRPRLPEIHGVFPGNTTDVAGQEAIFIGVPIERPLDGTRFEVIAVVRLGDSSAPRLVLPRAEAAAAHAAHLASFIARTP